MERHDVSIFFFFLWYTDCFDRVRNKHLDLKKRVRIRHLNPKYE